MIGQMILHYRVEALIGEGGMSTVYRGVNTKLGSPVAVKVLHPQYARDEKVRLRFEDEARIQAKLNHPNIVKVYDFHAERDRLCIMMELVEGRSLAEIIGEETGPLPFPTILEIMRQALLALDFAHEQGVIHRDIKPSNIMVQRLKGQVVAKVMDFGIAKIVGESKAKTSTGTRMGTLYYMSPEQLKSSRDVDRRSDLYSMGATLYQMATGKVPFDNDSDYHLMEAIVKESPALPSAVYPGVIRGLDAVIMKAMAKAPSERYQDAAHFLQDLEALAEGRAVQAEATTPAPSLRGVSPSPAPASGFSASPRLIAILAGLVGGLLVMVVALVGILSRFPSARPGAGTSADRPPNIGLSPFPSARPGAGDAVPTPATSSPSTAPPSSSFSSPHLSNDDPRLTVQQYFDLINKHDCSSLPPLREPCSNKVIRACQTTRWITIDQMHLLENDGWRAVVEIKNHGETTDGETKHFHQRLILARTSSGWKIVRMETMETY